MLPATFDQALTNPFSEAQDWYDSTKLKNTIVFCSTLRTLKILNCYIVLTMHNPSYLWQKMVFEFVF